MRPSTGLSNSKLNYTSSKLRNIAAVSNYEPQNHLNHANKQGFTKAAPSKKPPIAKIQSDLASTMNAQPKTPLLKKNTRNLSQSQFHNLNLGTKLLETLDSKDINLRPTPLPKSASRPHLNYTSNYKQPRLPIRAQNKVLKEVDENTSINRIPVSPISMKRAVNPQMGNSLAELPDGENMWTEGPTLDFSALHGLQSPNLAGTYSIKRNSMDVHENRQTKPGHFSTLSFQMSLPCELDSLKSFSKTVDTKQYNSTLNKMLQSPNTLLGDGETNLEKSETISCMSGQQLFSTIPCHSMADLNQRKTLKLQSSTMLDSETKDSIMKSPRLSQQTSIEAPLKVRQPNVENIERTSIKGSATTSQSSPKSKLANGNGDHSRTNSKLENMKTYLSKFDISNSTTIIKQIFQPKKRLRCSCDSGLDEDQTCSRALGWLKKKYHPNEFVYLKATYDKIVSDSKADNADQLKQIQKDVYRTYPNNKFYAADSPGLKSLQTVLNAFANYDPQIGYVQGMNFIGASLLYHAEEYITFWLLVMIFEIFEMRDIYLPKLPGLSKHCQIIDMLIFNYEHKLYLHLCQNEIKVEIFCTEWILALFASVIPVENMANFYEILLQQGWPFFYKVILGFLRQFEKQILEQDELLGILTVLKSQNHLIKNFAKDKNKMNLDWNALFQKAQKIEIDSHFIYKMHSNFDMDNQWFRTSFLKNT